MPVPGLTSTNTWLVEGIESQNKIGWGELLKGRMALDFETHQAKSNPNYHRGTNHLTQQHRTVPLVSLLFDHSELIWFNRNEAVHGRTPEEEEAAIELRLIKQIDALITQINIT